MNIKLSSTALFAALLFSNTILSNKALADKAVFAGGCFWCMEAVYQDLDGVSDVVSGFTGGNLRNPTYSGNHRGHYEAVEVTYNPDVINYQQLLDIYWVNIDPFDNRGQFCDKGPSYRSAIFVDAAQREAATKSRTQVMMQFKDETLYTEVLDQATFYPVEEYHQDYYQKNPIRYNFYKASCRRTARLDQIWGDAAAH
ncbi:MAG: peptide-methionine (S)-S-oxide reductase MsrA [Pseudomonadales bacterium]